MMKNAGMAAALSGAIALAAPAALAEDYKIGVLLPFSGVYAGLGAHIENGFKLGIEHFGDALGEHSISIVREDTEANPAKGLAKAKKLILQDKVDVLTGVVSSAVLGSVHSVVNGSKTPLLVSNAGNDLMTGEKCSPYITRISFSMSQIARPMGDYVARQGIKKVYLLASDYAAGHQQLKSFRASFEAAGGTIVGEAYPPLKGTQDYGPYLAAAKSSNPEAVYSFFAGGAAIAFVKQYHDFGLKKDIPLYGAGFLTSAAYVQVEGESADGVVSSLHYVPAIDTPENKRFQEAYKAAYEGKTGSEFAVAGYDAARAIIEAVKAAGSDKAKFKDLLRKVSFSGPRGPLKIDPATNNVIQNVYIFKNEYRDGKVVQTILDTYEDVQDAPNGCVM